jgi:hypothetical protein
LRGDRKRLPNELWLNRHGGGLLTPMRQNPRRSVLSQTGLRLTRFCLTWFCLTLLHLGEQAFNGPASSWRSLGVGLVPRHQRQSALRVSASGGARLETTQKLYNGEAEYRSGGRIRPS